MEKELLHIERSLKSSNITAGLELLQQLLTKAKISESNLRFILERLYGFGGQMIHEKNYKVVFPLFQILCKICSILEEDARLCDLKNSLSFCYRACGQTNLALKECLEALEVAGENKNLAAKLTALHLNACAIYREDIKAFVIARTHAELAYFFAKENSESGHDKDKRNLAVACYNYALVLENLKERHIAIKWYKDGLKFCEERWNDVYMEQAFREKVNTLSTPEILKSSQLTKSRNLSQKSGQSSYKYRFIKEIRGINTRSDNFKRKSNDKKKYSLTPLSNKTLPVHSVQYDPSPGNEYKIKIRSANTPSAGARSMIYHPAKPQKLSLVKSIIKIQRWLRRLKAPEKPALKFDYFTMGLKEIFGVRYFISIFKEKTSGKAGVIAFVEAWPLVRRTVKPKTIEIKIKQLEELLGSEAELMNNTELFLDCVDINMGRIVLVKKEILFSGDKEISGKKYRVTIRLHEKTLKIIAAGSGTVCECFIKLDPLQDSTNIKGKIPLILENLTIRAGLLIFNLM